MCDPISIAMVSVAAAQGIAQYNGQRQAANIQADSERQAYAFNDGQYQTQQEQVDQQASQQMSARALDALRQSGHLAALQASSGVGGNSDSRGFVDIANANATDQATIDANRNEIGRASCRE